MNTYNRFDIYYQDKKKKRCIIPLIHWWGGNRKIICSLSIGLGMYLSHKLLCYFEN